MLRGRASCFLGAPAAKVRMARWGRPGASPTSAAPARRRDCISDGFYRGVGRPYKRIRPVLAPSGFLRALHPEANRITHRIYYAVAASFLPLDRRAAVLDWSAYSGSGALHVDTVSTGPFGAAHPIHRVGHFRTTRDRLCHACRELSSGARHRAYNHSPWFLPGGWAERVAGPAQGGTSLGLGGTGPGNWRAPDGLDATGLFYRLVRPSAKVVWHQARLPGQLWHSWPRFRLDRSKVLVSSSALSPCPSHPSQGRSLRNDPAAHRRTALSRRTQYVAPRVRADSRRPHATDCADTPAPDTALIPPFQAVHTTSHVPTPHADVSPLSRSPSHDHPHAKHRRTTVVCRRVLWHAAPTH